MKYDAKLIGELEQKAKDVRREAVTLMRQLGFGWLQGSLSQADIIVALLFHHMKHDPKNPKWEERDRLIFSNAHCCETAYTAICEAGYFPREELPRYGKLGALLQAHVDRRAPGVEYSGGSLGQGLSFALGEALMARIGAQKDDSGKLIPRYRVFCIQGDGECDEGTVWEAAMAAAHYKVGNLIVIIDRNKFQRRGPVSETMNLEPFAQKWQAFGWDVVEINGHDFREILSALERADKALDKPHVIIAHTISCRGLPSCENKPLHMIKVTDDMYAEAMRVLK